MQSFLGLVKFYRQFVINMAKVAKPLTELTSNIELKWESSNEDSFKNPENFVTSDPVTRAFDPELRVAVACDARGCVVGAVL